MLPEFENFYILLPVKWIAYWSLSFTFTSQSLDLVKTKCMCVFALMGFLWCLLWVSDRITTKLCARTTAPTSLTSVMDDFDTYEESDRFEAPFLMHSSCLAVIPFLPVHIPSFSSFCYIEPNKTQHNVLRPSILLCEPYFTPMIYRLGALFNM